MPMELLDYYILTYAKERDQESQKNERKKVHNLIKKFERSPDIFGGLAFEYISIEEQAKIVHFFLEECSQRQIIDNLTKTNVDADFNVLEMNTQENLITTSAVHNYQPITIDLFELRHQIRGTSYNLMDLLENLFVYNDQIYKCYAEEYLNHKILGIKFDYIEYVTDYIDFSLNAILQFLLYPIMMYSKTADPIDVIDQLSNTIESLSKSFNDSLRQSYENAHGPGGPKAIKIMLYFRKFIEHRNSLFENSDIYKILVKEMEKQPELFSAVPDRYKAENILLTEEEIYSEKYKSIITEDYNVPNYKKKIGITRDFINVMKQYGGRNNVASSLQDIKVYFREIFMSKETYHRQKTSKIVKDYITQINSIKDNTNGCIFPEFQKKSQYIFVREKINRGFFREKNLSNVYIKKIYMTEKLNNLLLKSYWIIDSRSAIEILHDYCRMLLLCYAEFLK